MAALTVQNILDAYGRLKRDITDVPNATFTEWCDYANRFVYRKLSETEPEKFLDTETYIVTTEPQTSSLPTYFRDVQPRGTGFFLTDDNGDATEQRLPLTGYGSRAKGYYINGGNVIFTGINDTETYVLRYIPESTELTALADYFTQDGTASGDVIIDDEYKQYIVKAVDVLYDQWDEDTPAESLADFRFVRLLNDLITTMRKEPDAYAISDFSQLY